MAKDKLSAATLKSLSKKPITRIESHADGLGLAIRVTPSTKGENNAMLWMWRYRAGGKEQTLTLGAYPDLTLASARKRRDECRAWLAEGLCPRTELKLKNEQVLKPLTVKGALELWLDGYASKHRSNSDKHRQQFAKWIYPKVGELPAARVDLAHWNTCFEDSERAPVAAGLVLQNIKQAFRYCAKRKHEVNPSIFLLDLEMIGGQSANEKSRTLASETSNKELADLVRWLDSGKQPPYYHNLITLLLGFACRTQELRLSRKSEWDLEAGLWTVPAEHNKTAKRDQKNGLSGEIIRPIPDDLKPLITHLLADSDGEYLLGELKRSEAVSQFGRTIWAKLKHEQPWSLHDLRRTIATELNTLGVAPYIVEALLGHSLGKIQRTYNRSQYLPEKLEALSQWQERLAVMRQGDGKVLLWRARKHG